MKKRHRRTITRDLVLFMFGLGGIVHETVISHVDRPYLLLLFAYMVGLPMVSGLERSIVKLKEQSNNAEVVAD